MATGTGVDLKRANQVSTTQLLSSWSTSPVAFMSFLTALYYPAITASTAFLQMSLQSGDVYKRQSLQSLHYGPQTRHCFVATTSLCRTIGGRGKDQQRDLSASPLIEVGDSTQAIKTLSTVDFQSGSTRCWMVNRYQSQTSVPTI